MRVERDFQDTEVIKMFQTMDEKTLSLLAHAARRILLKSFFYSIKNQEPTDQESKGHLDLI